MPRLLVSIFVLLSLGLAAQAPPAPGDLLLSEILFDPVGEGADFVELYNASADTLSINGLQLINARGTTRTLTTEQWLPPAAYVVLTDNPQDILMHFPDAHPDFVLDLDLPSLPNTSGTVEIFTVDGVLLDRFDYEESMHSVLIDPEGVSLERRSFDLPSDTKDNWHSAASGAGYGTPTQPNSQGDVAAVTRPDVQLSEPVFFPASGGRQRSATVTYRTARPGWLAQLAVFDSAGRPVASQPRTELLGTRGALNWDGRDSTGTLQPAGPYVLLVNLFHPDGRTATFKFVAVLSS
ncbi:lamin tail domain-containing protein [Neolewinella sp.]|uniref:lamin tail domain-containing protein n=1 Tax=Neolewinella sp. TaxID=2993543 RepID=UPI003B524BB6